MPAWRIVESWKNLRKMQKKKNPIFLPIFKMKFQSSSLPFREIELLTEFNGEALENSEYFCGTIEKLIFYLILNIW